MSLFEYVTVAVSLVLSLAVVRLLDGLRFAASRDRGDWVHFLWVVTKLFNCALYWWGLWSTRESVAWNFASFMWVLLFPGTLYLQCTSLVTSAPQEVPSWRDHFYDIRRWFLAINLVLVAHAFITSAIFLSVPVLDLSRVPIFVLLVFNVAGLFSADPRLHALIVVVALLANILGFGAVWFQPGA